MKLETGGIRKLLWDINRKEPGSKNSILTHLKPTDLKHKEKPGGGGGHYIYYSAEERKVYTAIGSYSCGIVITKI